MKKLLFLISIVFVCSIMMQKTASAKTKHKTVVKMSRRQVKNAKKGKTFYYRNKKGKLKKRIL